MKTIAWILFLFCMSLASAYHTFDYTKNGFAVPGSVNVLIPDIHEVIPTVSSTTLVTTPSPRGAQMFTESAVLSVPVGAGLRYLGRDQRISVPAHPINPRSRAPGVYIGDYGLSRQYIKSISS